MLDIGGAWMSYIRAALYLLLFALWGFSLDRRIIQKQALHCLRLTAALMLVWLVLRTLKYEFVTDLTAARYIWYLYYLPMLFIPLLGVYIALSLGKPQEIPIEFYCEIPAPEIAPIDDGLWCVIEDNLTYKQFEAIQFRNQGYTNREIAELCGVGRKAIEKR